MIRKYTGDYETDKLAEIELKWIALYKSKHGGKEPSEEELRKFIQENGKG